MYALQTASSPRRTNYRIQRNIGNQHNDCSSIKETNFFWSNFGWKLWNSHNSNFSQLKFAIRLVICSLFFLMIAIPHPWCYPYPRFSNAALGMISSLLFRWCVLQTFSCVILNTFFKSTYWLSSDLFPDTDYMYHKILLLDLLNCLVSWNVLPGEAQKTLWVDGSSHRA